MPRAAHLSDAAVADVSAPELVARHLAGDVTAFAALYRRHSGRVSSYLRATLSSADAQDVAQLVFEAVFEALPGYRPDGTPFENWLLRIARNKAIDHIRRNHRTSPHAPEDVAELRELRDREESLRPLAWGSTERLHQHLRRLPCAQREVLVLHYLAGLSKAEIGTVTGRAPTAVRQLHSRALTRLAADLSTGMPPPRAP